MAPSFWTQHQLGLIYFLGALLLIALANLRAFRRIGEYGRSLPPGPLPRVSILVPARNEEAHIGACLRSLLEQDYPDFEVLALDDQSEDATREILAGLAAGYGPRLNGRLMVLAGAEPPPGWLGKNWACHQLARAASGELLLFTDADTRHHPLALSEAVAALLAEDAALLSAVPHEEVLTLGEKLAVPLITWSLFAFLPLGLAKAVRWPGLAAAVGQYLLFRRAAYERIGGHAAVRDHAAEDLALARRAAACGERVRLLDAGRRVRCRMYPGWRQAASGLSKNLFAAFNYNAWTFVPIWLWLGVVFLEPPVVLLSGLAGFPLEAFSPALAAVAAAQALLLWGLHAWRFGYSPAQALLYPFNILAGMALAASALYLAYTGGATWKGRALPRVGR